MSGERVFRMGRFEAKFPNDRQYAKNHMWAQQHGDEWRFGFSAYAVRLLQDVYFLDWDVDERSPMRERGRLGCVESEKAESDLFAPMEGVLNEFNQNLLSDPSTINVDTYGAGWLFSMQGKGDTLLSPQEYMIHLEASWDVAQRLIKGQINE